MGERSALALQRVDAPWPVIPAVTASQILLRHEGIRPRILSARALIMLYGIATNASTSDTANNEDMLPRLGA